MEWEYVCHIVTALFEVCGCLLNGTTDNFGVRIIHFGSYIDFKY